MSDAEHVEAKTPSGAPRSVIAGAFAIVRTLLDRNETVSSTALARATGIPRSSVIRLLYQLEGEGVVRREDGHWSARVRLMDQHGSRAAYPRAETMGLLQWLGAQSGATVSLVSESRGTFTADVMLAGRDLLPIRARHGSWMPPDSAAAIAISGARRSGARRSVVAVDRERCIAGLTCIAVPLDGGGSVPPLALQLATAPENAADRHAPLLLRAREALLEMAGGASAE